MIEIVKINLGDVLKVCQNMRLADWREVLNLLPGSVHTAEVVAMIVMQVSRIGFVAKIDGEPIGVIQAAEVLDNTFRFGMFGTERFPEVAVPLAGHMMDAFEEFVADGAVFGEAYADALHEEAHKLLKFLGFKNVVILPEYGSRGGDIAVFIMTKGMWNVYGRRRRRIVASAASAERGRSASDRGTAGVPQAEG